MPRQARLDAPGTLHHVIIRGIEKRAIVSDDTDREDFVVRLGRAADVTRTTIFAWALLPNHAHILLRSGPTGLPTFMRKFLTGYAIRFNHRHRRHGHLFQNRYKSIVCDEDAYFRELVRYIHLNPLRAKLVESMERLDRYPWCGHSVVMGKSLRPWQDSRYVLSWFGSRDKTSRRMYRSFIAQGVLQGRRPELVGGGLIRSLGGWSQVRSMRIKDMRIQADERILGSGEFVDRMLGEAEQHVRHQLPNRQVIRQAEQYIERQCQAHGVSMVELQGGGRRSSIARLRLLLARYLVSQLGLPLAETARQLGVTTSGISRALLRGGGVLER